MGTEFLAEGLVTLDGAPIMADALPSWLRGQNYNRVWYSHEPDVSPTIVVGGAEVARSVMRLLAVADSATVWSKSNPLPNGYREPSHVRWDEVLEFSKTHPHSWHEVRERFDRKPKWKK